MLNLCKTKQQKGCCVSSTPFNFGIANENRLCLSTKAFLWRRWRDSNSRGAFDPYTISNRARSTSYATSPNMPVVVNRQYYTQRNSVCQAFFNFFSFLGAFSTSPALVNAHLVISGPTNSYTNVAQRVTVRIRSPWEGRAVTAIWLIPMATPA